ncbi:MAG: ribosome silencing factor [Bacteroidetes bacterium]|nr:ribosome silencing factor [Bacteroidota bacterium]MBU1422573.1 ribosome silencing factor [Bacteroidota bacterium]
MAPKTLAKNIAKLTFTKKASDVMIMDLKKITDIADYFVLCSADSDTQVKAIANAVLDGTEKNGIRAWRTEGFSESLWIILDYVDVVTHIFQKEVRKYYNLERLWGDAKIEVLEDKPKSTMKKSVKLKKVKVERVPKK